jgi:predicted PurR-regulated permease PerM/CheY-like chemotaxis protein
VANSSAKQPRDSLLLLCGLVLVTACLYWARQVFIPLALAVLLAFILTPAVAALQRRGLGRLPSVLLVVTLALLLLGAVGYLISRQINTLVADLPKYKGEITAKFQDLLGATKGGFLGRTKEVLGEISQQAKNGDKNGQSESKNKNDRESDSSKEGDKAKPGEAPEMPLYVQSAPSGWTWMGNLIGPAAEGLGDAFLVLVLVIFMLMQRENLRNRMVRLIGHGRIIVTTQAFDEGGQRISRYLLMQLFINTLFGVTLGVGLFAIGLLTGHQQLWHYALFWGFIAVVMRFVPYLGTWVAAALVTGFSIATLTGWSLPLVILGFFIVIELLTANVVEPLLFGHSTGVSPLALLLAAAFWTWLWGPLGLILSTPLTVTLVVLGKYVPELRFFEVLLGDEQVLSTDLMFYQRLVARDTDEAADLVEEHLDGHPPEEAFEEVLLPALLHAKRDYDSGELETDSYNFVLQGVRDGVEEVAASVQERIGDASVNGDIYAVGCPGHDDADELALRMLAQLIRSAGYSMKVVSSEKLCAEVLGQLAQEAPAVVVIGSLPPGGLAQTRYLCKRIRQQAPDIKILIGRWGEKDKNERREQRLLSSGADHVSRTLCDSRTVIVPLLQMAAKAAPADAGSHAECGNEKLITSS